MLAPLGPPANECHWPSALAVGADDPCEAAIDGPEDRAVEPARAFAPKRALDGGPAADLLPPALFGVATRFPEALLERLPENDLLLNAGIPAGRPVEAFDLAPEPLGLPYEELPRYADEGAPPRYPLLPLNDRALGAL